MISVSSSQTSSENPNYELKSFEGCVKRFEAGKLNYYLAYRDSFPIAMEESDIS